MVSLALLSFLHFQLHLLTAVLVPASALIRSLGELIQLIKPEENRFVVVWAF